MIRGLALRALTSLRIPSILEYVMPPLKVRRRRGRWALILTHSRAPLPHPLQASLTDHSGYVRQNGVMGVLKVRGGAGTCRRCVCSHFPRPSPLSPPPLSSLQVFHLAPETAKDYDFVDTLYNMLRDSDPQARMGKAAACLRASL